MQRVGAMARRRKARGRPPIVTTTTSPTPGATLSPTTTSVPVLDDEGALDILLLETPELPEGMPSVPVPPRGTLNTTLSYFEEESVIYKYPNGTMPTLVSFYGRGSGAKESIPTPPSDPVPRASGTMWRDGATGRGIAGAGVAFRRAPADHRGSPLPPVVVLPIVGLLLSSSIRTARRHRAPLLHPEAAVADRLAQAVVRVVARLAVLGVLALVPLVFLSGIS